MEFTVPKVARALVGVLSAAVAASALVGIVAAYSLNAKPGWAMVGFEVVTVVAGVLGIAFAKGRFADGPALALACIAGTVFVASGLGYIGVSGQLGKFPLKAFVVARAVAALIISGLGAHLALSRHPKGWATAIKGCILGVPGAALVAIAILPPGQRLVKPVLSVNGFLSTALVIVAFLIATASISAAVHLVIKAFSLGRLEGTPRPA